MINARRLFVPLILISSAAWADEASKAAKIEEILQISKTSQGLQQIVEQMRNMQMAQVAKMKLPPAEQARSEEIQKKIMDLVAGRLSWDRMKPLLVKMYADTFSESELDGILNFYKSPAGQAMLEKMPALMQRTMSLAQEAASGLQPEIERIVRAAANQN